MLPLRLALRLSLLAAALVAANLVHAEVPASAPFTPEQQHLIRQLSASEVKAATPEIASEAASSVAKTIAGEKQAIEVAKDALEVGRKSVDFWLSFLGVLTGAIALFGVIAPWLAAKNYKADIEKQASEMRKLADEAKEELVQVIELTREGRSQLDEQFKYLNDKENVLNELAKAIDAKHQRLIEISQMSATKDKPGDKFETSPEDVDNS